MASALRREQDVPRGHEQRKQTVRARSLESPASLECSLRRCRASLDPRYRRASSGLSRDPPDIFASGPEATSGGVVPLFELLAEAPGFIRRYGFGDGPSNTLIALWQTIEDAKAFAATPQHREAVRNLYRQRWQYTHFAALWEMSTNHDRIAFCDRCEATTPASRGTCSECGQQITDIYAPWQSLAIAHSAVSGT